MHNGQQPTIKQWRATGPYTASSALFSGLLEETRLFLWTYAEQSGSVAKRVELTKQLLVDGRLPQRSRSSRKSIAGRISLRLTSWNPPGWVLDDLASFAGRTTPANLETALLMHVCRQDPLLYGVVQNVIVPKWRKGSLTIEPTDVQQFLDQQLPDHPEISTWTRQTRARLGSMTLTILRDYGLLEGKSHKTIVAPVVPLEVCGHAVRLLEAEGVANRSIPRHADWRLWLWTEKQTRQVLSELVTS